MMNEPEDHDREKRRWNDVARLFVLDERGVAVVAVGPVRLACGRADRQAARSQAAIQLPDGFPENVGRLPMALNGPDCDVRQCPRSGEHAACSPSGTPRPRSALAC